MSSPTTTVALLTPRGRGAVATLLLRGDLGLLTERQLFRAANGKPIKEQSLGRIVFGHWIGGEGTCESEEIVLCRRSLDEVEIHCHGGSAPAARIAGDLENAGCLVQTWQEMTTEREGRFTTESLAALASAPTLRSASILARQVSGVFSRAIERLLAISFNDPTDFELAQSQIDELLSWSDFGRHLTRPWQVVLTGRPNVGKSSLINALLGFTRSIVYDEPGTTRDVVTAETAFDGWPVELADTAGLRHAAVGLEAAGIALAHERLATADCRVLLLDHSTPLTPEDQSLLRLWPDAIVVAHKSDLPCAWLDRQEIPVGRVGVSSHTGVGIDVLIGAIAHHLVPRTPAAETAVPFTERQIDLLGQARAATTRKSGVEVQNALREILAK